MRRLVTFIISGAVSAGTILTHRRLVTRKNKPTIVLDLDNTLVHSVTIDEDFNYKYLPRSNEVTVGDDKYRVWRRPFAGIIIPLLTQYADVHLFTAAKRDYTTAVMDAVGLSPQDFKSITTRDDVDRDTKDLTAVTSAQDAVLVDDNLSNGHPWQLFYHIPRYKWYNRCDIELLILLATVVAKPYNLGIVITPPSSEVRRGRSADIF